jgi:hypothetical protein
MKVSLKSKEANCRSYGLEFDCEGIAEAKPEVVKSLIDSGVLVEVKSKKVSK